VSEPPQRLKLTRRQAEVMLAIYDLIAAHGRPPTFREVAGVMGFKSPNAVQCHLNPLRKKGAVLPQQKKHDGIVPAALDAAYREAARVEAELFRHQLRLQVVE
jgi:SOS-response transcriptional repressor LexA